MRIKEPSSGEKKIIDILKANKISFIREYSFPDLKSYKGVPLRFDFVVVKDSRIICCIEYDGQSHYDFIKYFHKNIFGFRQAKERDRQKNQYCLRKGIPLIRIPYWDYDNLTFESIFTNSDYLVKNKYHNDYLISRGEKK